MAISPQEWEDQREALALAKLKAAADKQYEKQQQAMNNAINASSLFPDEWKVNMGAAGTAGATGGLVNLGGFQQNVQAQVGQASQYVHPMESEMVLVEFTLGRRSARCSYSNVTYIDDIDHAVAVYGERVRAPILMLQASCPLSHDTVNKIDGTGSVRRLQDDTLYMRIVL